MEEDRGYTIAGVNVVPVTQAIDDSENEATFLSFGELTTKKIRSIEEACSKCDFWKGRFSDTAKCQEAQGSDARGRGFSKLVCPEQFIEEEDDGRGVHREQMYLVFLDENGLAIGKPEKVAVGKEADTILENKPKVEGVYVQFLATKEQILKGRHGLSEKDFS